MYLIRSTCLQVNKTQLLKSGNCAVKSLKKLPLEQVEILVLILAWVLLVSIFGFFGSIFFGIHELGDNFPFVTSRIVMIGV